MFFEKQKTPIIFISFSFSFLFQKNMFQESENTPWWGFLKYGLFKKKKVLVLSKNENWELYERKMRYPIGVPLSVHELHWFI